MIKKKDMEYILGLMVNNIQVGGSMGNKKGLECMLQVEKLSMDFGKMERKAICLF